MRRRTALRSLVALFVLTAAACSSHAPPMLYDGDGNFVGVGAGGNFTVVMVRTFERPVLFWINSQQLGSTHQRVWFETPDCSGTPFVNARAVDEGGEARKFAATYLDLLGDNQVYVVAESKARNVVVQSTVTGREPATCRPAGFNSTAYPMEPIGTFEQPTPPLRWR